MVSVTILGAGVTGLTIASQLPIDYRVTIVGQHLPDDPVDFDYASQWGGACWVGVPNSSPRDQKLQLDAYSGLYRIASEHTDSGLKISEVKEVIEQGVHASPEEIWWQDKIPGFRFLKPDELPERAEWGMIYPSIIISPQVFLKWLKARLAARGVQFKRMAIRDLHELRHLGHDILINASGANARFLPSISEKSLVPIRLQSVVIERDWGEGFIYRGRDGFYFNIFGRPDGTCYVGGVKDFGSDDRTIYDEQRQTILTRGSQVLSKIFPSDKLDDYKVLYDIATTYHYRPQELGGTRVEKEIVDGQRVIHAYGQEAGGFSYSFGVARIVAELVSDCVFEFPLFSRL
ncbi:FAD dependent oxidoreductase [Fusarium pseudocircinatum]|uniref:FAD dependent oxidoreductase n=1 Tax=Fusarium pseudocircinatum TaxID=56676 RepID=A0A8H5NQG7_9HYPO|nr:FAD dependent oxidoreductase [Fusarium pseudocircinatum]